MDQLHTLGENHEYQESTNTTDNDRGLRTRHVAADGDEARPRLAMPAAASYRPVMFGSRSFRRASSRVTATRAHITTLGNRTFIRLGNFDRRLDTPGTHWPNAYPMTPYWYKNCQMLVYDPDPTFNPETIGGAANPSYFCGARPTGTRRISIRILPS